MPDISRRRALWLLAGMAVLVAGVLSYFASSHPDALEHSLDAYKADAPGPAGTAGAPSRSQAATPASPEGRAGYRAPLPDYSLPGANQSFVSGGVAGVIGALGTFAVIVLFAVLLRSRRPRDSRVG